MSDWKPEITVLTCQYCGNVPVEMAGAQHIQYPATVKVQVLPCAGRVDILHLLRALEQGVDGVLVMTCPEGNCHHLAGNDRAAARVAYARELVAETGLEPQRLQVTRLGIGQGQTIADLVGTMAATLGGLGPNPMRVKAGRA